jgi:hypothetical protein
LAFILNFYLSSTTSEPLVLVPSNKPEYKLPLFTIKPPEEIQAGAIGHWQLTYTYDDGGGLSVFYQIGQAQFCFPLK